MRKSNNTSYPDAHSCTSVQFPDANSYSAMKARQKDYQLRAYFANEECLRYNGRVFAVTLTYNESAIRHLSEFFPDFPVFWNENRLKEFVNSKEVRDYLGNDKNLKEEFRFFTDIYSEMLRTTGIIDFPCPCSDDFHFAFSDTSSRFRKIIARRYHCKVSFLCGTELGEGKGERGIANNPHLHVVFFITPDINNSRSYVPNLHEFRELVRESWQYQYILDDSGNIAKDSSGQLLFDTKTDYQTARLGHVDVSPVQSSYAQYVTKYAIKLHVTMDTYRDLMMRYFSRQFPLKNLMFTNASMYNYYLYLAHNCASYGLGNEVTATHYAYRHGSRELVIDSSVSRSLRENRYNFMVNSGLHTFWLWRNADRSFRKRFTFRDFMFMRYMTFHVSDIDNQYPNVEQYKYSCDNLSACLLYLTTMKHGLYEFDDVKRNTYIPMADYLQYYSFMTDAYSKQYSSSCYRDYHNHYSTKFRVSKTLGLYGIPFMRNYMAGKPVLTTHTSKSVDINRPTSYYLKKCGKDTFIESSTGHLVYKDNALGIEYKVNSLLDIIDEKEKKLAKFLGFYNVNTNRTFCSFVLSSSDYKTIADDIHMRISEDSIPVWLTSELYHDYKVNGTELPEPLSSSVDSLCSLVEHAITSVNQLNSYHFRKKFTALKGVYDSVYRDRSFYVYSGTDVLCDSESDLHIHDMVGFPFLAADSFPDVVTPFTDDSGNEVSPLTLIQKDYRRFLTLSALNRNYSGKYLTIRIKGAYVVSSPVEHAISNVCSESCADSFLYCQHPLFADFVVLFSVVDVMFNMFNKYDESVRRKQEVDRLVTRNKYARASHSA